MKRLLLITGILLTAYVILMSAVAPTSATPAGAAETVSESGIYTVGESGGRVAVFTDGELFRITDTLVCDLPKADRTKLSEGITVYSEKELKRLLEDICS